MFDNLFSLKTSIVDKLKTGNVLIDMIIATFVMVLINKVQYYLNYDNIVDIINIKNFSLRKKYSLNYEYQKATNAYSVNNFSIIYLSIMNYISNNTKIEVNSLTHINSGRFESSENDKRTKINDLFYSLDERNFEIMISKDIYCTITKSEDEVKSELTSYKIIKNNIEIYSYKYNTDYLKDFIKKECYEPFLINFNNDFKGKQFLFKYINYDTEWERFNIHKRELLNTRNFDSIFFEQKEKLIEQLDFFLNNKEWYLKKGIPYKLGIILYGYPGCGKTSIIKAILNYTKRHGLFINLNNFEKENEFQRIFSEKEIMNHHVPHNQRVYIFEEMDTCKITKKRNEDFEEIPEKIDGIETKLVEAFMKKNGSDTSIKSSNEMTLGTLLNLFDGIDSSEGTIVIATTNHINKIDPALIRPGRMDIHIELQKCSRLITLQLLEHFYEIDYVTLHKKYSSKIIEYQYSPAEINQICFKNRTSIDDCINELYN
jgi:ATP-dependent Zn protease